MTYNIVITVLPKPEFSDNKLTCRSLSVRLFLSRYHMHSLIIFLNEDDLVSRSP
jgi:hypothetical protein